MAFARRARCAMGSGCAAKQRTMRRLCRACAETDKTYHYSCRKRRTAVAADQSSDAENEAHHAVLVAQQQEEICRRPTYRSRFCGISLSFQRISNGLLPVILPRRYLLSSPNLSQQKTKAFPSKTDFIRRFLYLATFSAAVVNYTSSALLPAIP